jgi:hypothetical protein
MYILSGFNYCTNKRHARYFSAVVSQISEEIENEKCGNDDQEPGEWPSENDASDSQCNATMRTSVNERQVLRLVPRRSASAIALTHACSKDNSSLSPLSATQESTATEGTRERWVHESLETPNLPPRGRWAWCLQLLLSRLQTKAGAELVKERKELLKELR